MAWADWTDVVAVTVAFGIAAVTTPAGVSGAVLLPPFQASALDTHIMAIAPTNLVYNIIATPGALYRYWRQGQTGGRLTVLLIAGAVPGVVAGCVIRAMFLPGMATFDFLVAGVLMPFGGWLALVRAPEPEARRSRLPARRWWPSRWWSGVSAGSTESAAARRWRRC